MKIVSILILLISFNLCAQVGINTTTTTTTNESAALDIQSSEKGILIPRLSTEEKQAITDPAANLLIFDTDENNYEYNSGIPAQPEWTRTLDETYSGARAAMNITSSAYDAGPQTTFSTKGIATRQKIAGTTNASDLANFQASGNNRLVYTGSQTRYFRVSTSVSFYSSANNTILAFYVAKGNSGSNIPTVLQDTKSYVISSGTSDVVTVPITGSLELSQGDFIEIWVEREADSGGGSNAFIRVSKMNVVIN